MAGVGLTCMLRLMSQHMLGEACAARAPHVAERIGHRAWVREACLTVPVCFVLTIAALVFLIFVGLEACKLAELLLVSRLGIRCLLLGGLLAKRDLAEGEQRVGKHLAELDVAHAAEVVGAKVHECTVDIHLDRVSAVRVMLRGER